MSRIARAGVQLQRLRRAGIEQSLSVRVVGLHERPGATLIAANHAGRIDRQAISAAWPTPVVGEGVALRAGMSVLVFPEGGISPDGSLGRFRPEAFEAVRALWRSGQRIPITPVGVVGTFGVDRQVPWWSSAAERVMVTIRVGDPIGPSDDPADVLAERVRDAVSGLLAESRSTWWQQELNPAPVESNAAPTWRNAWLTSARTVAPGRARARKIWG